MKQKTLTYTNIKYNFIHSTDIKLLSKEDIIRFQNLYSSNQISKKDYDNIISILKTYLNFKTLAYN